MTNPSMKVCGKSLKAFYVKQPLSNIFKCYVLSYAMESKKLDLYVRRARSLLSFKSILLKAGRAVPSPYFNKISSGQISPDPHFLPRMVLNNRHPIFSTEISRSVIEIKKNC